MTRNGSPASSFDLKSVDFCFVILEGQYLKDVLVEVKLCSKAYSYDHFQNRMNKIFCRYVSTLFFLYLEKYTKQCNQIAQKKSYNKI